MKMAAIEAIAAMDKAVTELRAALRWCLDEGLDDYVQETELQRLTEYRALLKDPLKHPEHCHHEN